jgi:hypothetical protein
MESALEKITGREFSGLRLLPACTLTLTGPLTSTNRRLIGLATTLWNFSWRLKEDRWHSERLTAEEFCSYRKSSKLVAVPEGRYALQNCGLSTKGTFLHD